MHLKLRPGGFPTSLGRLGLLDRRIYPVAAVIFSFTNEIIFRGQRSRLETNRRYTGLVPTTSRTSNRHDLLFRNRSALELNLQRCGQGSEREGGKGRPGVKRTAIKNRNSK